MALASTFHVNCYIQVDSFVNTVMMQLSTCYELLERYNARNDSEQVASTCPPMFDGYCWPETLGGNLAEIYCPFGPEMTTTMSRWCSENLTMITGSANVTGTAWSSDVYYGGGCEKVSERELAMIVDESSKPATDATYLDVWYEKLDTLDKTGYAVSSVSLLVSLMIFAKFSQLQETRVKVHINLFVAMLLHSIASLCLTFTYVCGNFDLVLIDTDVYDGRSRICRCLMALSHYFELTIYTWLLVEGWYFYNLISRAIYREKSSIKWQAVMGWASPLAVIIPWIFFHYTASDANFCWIDLDWKINITAVPILLMVLINLGFFVLNIRFIFAKMQNPYKLHRRTHYWRWLKSSLMLMPLFGSYDIIYAVWPWIVDPTVKIVLLVFIKLICSFQGFVVSVLYCFANGHVRNEIKRAWRNRRISNEIESDIRRSRHNCSSVSVVDRV